MATETIPGPLGEVRAASTASGGTALSTTATRIVLPLKTKHVTLIPRNFATAVVVKFNKNPYLAVIKTADSLATVTDYSSEAQDGSASTDVTLSSMDTSSNGDSLYVGAHVPFSGLAVDVDAANASAATLSVRYWNGVNGFADITPTDGTASGGATFAQDGNITWTIPSDWAPSRLFETESVAGNFLYAHDWLYWLRLRVSAQLDASTTLNSLIAINRDTTYAEIPSGMWWEEAVNVGLGGYSSITALTDAGTANLIVNCATRAPGAF